MALRGLPVDNGDEADESEGDDDIEEAGELGPDDENLAAVAPVGGIPEKAKSAQTAGSSLRAPDVLKSVWATNVRGDDEGDDGADIFCVRHSPDDTLVAAGCGDGVVRLFHTDGGRLAYSLFDGDAQLPATCLRFRPAGGGGSTTRNILLAASTDGTVKHWHITSKRCLHTVTEKDNQVYAIDYTTDGGRFVTAGRDYTVRLYDEATKTCVTSLCSSFDKSTSGHSNRIFSVKFSELQPDVLFSGGWDNTLQVWDARAGYAVKSIWGPHICGDAIDAHEHTILTGSWRPEQQLQLWDMRTGGLSDTIGWGPAAQGREPCQVYAAQFSKQGAGFIAAGGSGANELKIFSVAQKAAIGVFTLPKGVYGVDFSHNGKTVAIAAGDSSVRVVSAMTSRS